MGPLALVAKGEISKEKKSKEKVVVDDSDSNATYDEFTSEEKALVISNLKKLFKKNYSKFRGNGNARTDGGGIGYKWGNSYAEQNKCDGVKNYQQE